MTMNLHLNTKLNAKTTATNVLNVKTLFTLLLLYNSLARVLGHYKNDMWPLNPSPGGLVILDGNLRMVSSTQGV